MTFKTKEEMFGDGGGFGAAVPYSTSNPAGTSSGNRGVQFGESLTASVANRTHYALALNDEDLNDRITAFETAGLDGAYDLGTVGPAGGGREITKDAGAVETVSGLSASYEDDVANAHFRANQIGDTSRGGGGFESVSYGRSGVSALYGLLDRRAVNFSGYSVVADTINVTLATNVVTVGAGQLRDGSSNTHIIVGYDLVEILTGTDPGLYVITSITGGTTCAVLALDGTTPAFTAGAATARIFRPVFGTFNRFGHSGTLGYRTNYVSGVPGQEASLELIPGATLGRFETASASPDGARYALQAKWKNAAGTLSTRFSVDSQGQVRSAVSSQQLTAAQLTAAQDFGSPAFFVQQDESNQLEVGYLAKSVGDAEAWIGVGTAGAATTAEDFTFINVAPYNIQFTDTDVADFFVNPTVTFIEIVTPSAQAGIYSVVSRGVATGRVQLETLDSGATPVSFPTSGSGTARVLFGVSLGNRLVDVGTSVDTDYGTAIQAAAVVSAPRLDGSAALVLETGDDSASTGDFFFFRCLRSHIGVTSEVAHLTASGRLTAKTITAVSGFVTDTTDYYSASGDFVTDAGNFVAPDGDSYTFASPVARTLIVGRDHFLETVDDEWIAVNGNAVTSDKAGSGTARPVLWCPLNKLLPLGCTLTRVDVLALPGDANSSGSRVDVTFYENSSINFTVSSENAGTDTSIDTGEDDGTTNLQSVFISGLSTVITATSFWSLRIRAGAGVSEDTIYGIRLSFTESYVSSH